MSKCIYFIVIAIVIDFGLPLSDHITVPYNKIDLVLISVLLSHIQFAFACLKLNVKVHVTKFSN